MLMNLKLLLVTWLLTAISIFLFYKGLKKEVANELSFRPALAILGVFAVSFLSPNGWVAILLALALIPCVARSAKDIGAIYVAAAICSPGIVKSLSVGPIQSIGTLGIVDAIGISCLLYLLASGRRAKWTAVDASFWLIFALLAITSLREGSVAGTLRYLLHLCFMLGIPFAVIRRAAVSRGEVHNTMLGVVLATIVLSMIFIFESARHWPLFPTVVQGLSDIQPSNIVKMRGGMLRASGPILEAMSAGMVAMAGALLAFALRKSFKSVWWLLVLLIVVTGTYMPQSRNALLGLVVGIMAIEFIRKRWATLFALGSAGSAFIVASITGLTSSSLFTSDVSGSNDYRSQLLARGLEELRDKPVFGFSSQEMLFRLADMRQGEGIIDIVNVWLWFALMTGLVGLSLFVLAVGAAIISGVRQARASRDQILTGDTMAACAGCLCAIATMFAFTSFSGMPVLLTFLLISLIASSSVARDIPASPKPVPADELKALRPLTVEQAPTGREGMPIPQLKGSTTML